MEGWNLELNDSTLFFIRLLLAQAGIAVGSEEGIYVEEVTATVNGTHVRTSDHKVHHLVSWKV